MRLPNGESVIDPKSVNFIFRKFLSVENINSKLKDIFSTAKDNRIRAKVKISLTDALMSGFAMFSLKSKSLLAFDSNRGDEAQRENLKNLFGIDNIPSDTSMREILDEVNPTELRPAFKEIFSKLQRGKMLEPYAFINGQYLIAIDGTGYFSSEKIHCKCCLEKHHKKSGKITYHHQMLAAVLIHPAKKEVVPLCPEPIIRQDGQNKNDCERNACSRILAKIRKDHPKLKIIITEDGLASNAPHIKDIKQNGMSYILIAKPRDHKHLFEEYSLAGSRCKKLIIREEKSVHIFRYVNDLPLNESNEDVRVNFLDYEECKTNGSTVHFSWVTDIEIRDENVMQIMQGGRARWKIENETFNTLKNQGYEFEHNYGHGYKNLSTVLAYLMMLAFLVDQTQLLSNKILVKALTKVKRLSALYGKIRHYFETFIFKSWQELYGAIAYGIKAEFSIKSDNTS